MKLKGVCRLQKRCPCGLWQRTLGSAEDQPARKHSWSHLMYSASRQAQLPLYPRPSPNSLKVRGVCVRGGVCVKPCLELIMSLKDSAAYLVNLFFRWHQSSVWRYEGFCPWLHWLWQHGKAAYPRDKYSSTLVQNYWNKVRLSLLCVLYNVVTVLVKIKHHN